MPTVSVIIPAYNAQTFLREAVDSALGQTLCPLEVIIIDDGSTDSTCHIAATYADRIRLIQQPNGGVAKARNTGARQARGEWLAFLDADDVWLPHKLEHQLQSGTAAMIYCDRYNVGETCGLPSVQSAVQPLVEGEVFVDLLLVGNVITTSTVLLRREVFWEVGGFDEDPRLPVAEDWDLWLRVADICPIAACREPLVRYRLQSTSASRDPRIMNSARRFVVAKALRSTRGRSLPAMTRRRIWAQTFQTNGWDAARHGRRLWALGEYACAIGSWPLRLGPYRDVARVLLGRT